MNLSQVYFRLLFALASTSACCGALAQATWRRAYGAYGPEEGRSVRVADDGNFVVAGSTGSFGFGTSDIYMVKIDGGGIVLWSRTIGGPMIEQAADLFQLDDGGWLIVGSTNGEGSAGGYDGLLVRTDPEGNVEWQKDYGGSDWDFFRSGMLLGDGGFLLVGQTFSQGSGGDAWLVRTNPLGDTLWTRHFGGEGLDDGQAIVSTPDGGLAFAGSTTVDNGDLDAFVVKLDDQHNIQWANTYGGDSLDLARDIVATQDGGYSIVGITRSYADFVEHYHFKVDADGGLQWQKHWGQIDEQEAYRHIELAAGGYATVGWTKTSGGGARDMFIFLCDSQGEFIEQHTFGGSGDDEGCALAKCPGGFIVCGQTRSYGAGSEDVFLVRTDSTGNTASENVTGYFDPLSVEDVGGGGKPILFPNPTSGIIHISAIEYVELDLIDAVGRTLISWDGRSEEIDLHEFANGTYYLRAAGRDGSIRISPLVLNKP